MPELFRLTTLDEARRALEAALPPQVLAGRLGMEEIPLARACGRTAAEDILSPVDLPPFARSIMDGFAVRARDTFGATEGTGAQLRVIAEIRMGEQTTERLSTGQAAKIPTGGMLPPGADAVVMVEYTQPFGPADEKPWGAALIEVLRSVAPGENVIQVGEDIHAGEVLIRAGQQLRPQEIAALAGVGLLSVKVYRKPRLGLLSTGNEIVPPEVEPPPGKIRDMNSAALAAAAERAGAEVAFFGIVADKKEELRRRLQEAFAASDIVVLSGGTSVGVEDFVAECISELGPPGILVHGLSIKPGKPVIIAVAAGKPVFGLPGHPTSSLLTFDLVVAPLLRKMAHLSERTPPRVQAKLGRNLPSAAGREDFYRVRLETREDGIWAIPILGKSALISTLLRADGLLHIPADREGLYEGEEVVVELF